MLTILYGKLETKVELRTTLLETILTVEFCVILTPSQLVCHHFTWHKFKERNETSEMCGLDRDHLCGYKSYQKGKRKFLKLNCF